MSLLEARLQATDDLGHTSGFLQPVIKFRHSSSPSNQPATAAARATRKTIKPKAAIAAHAPAHMNTQMSVMTAPAMRAARVMG